MKKIYVCYPQGKFKALTFSYDDGTVMDRRLVELFDRYHVKGTFHLNSGFLGSREGHTYPYIEREEVKRLYSNHEVASHTCTHSTMPRTSTILAVQEVLEDRIALETLTEMLVTGMSYPNGVYSAQVKDILKHCGIKYSRTTKNTESFDLPEDYLEWHPTCHHNSSRLFELGQFMIDRTYDQRLMLLYVWGHSYEFERDGNWRRMEDFLKLVSGREDIWYATNGEICSYMEASSRLEYAADLSKVWNPGYQSVWIQVDGRFEEVKGGQVLCI